VRRTFFPTALRKHHPLMASVFDIFDNIATRRAGHMGRSFLHAAADKIA
jgi:hypothetical protein